MSGWVWALALGVVVRVCVVEPFEIPTGSMLPTLRPGDRILVNKWIHGVQLPFTNVVLGGNLRGVRRGEAVVFRYPLDPSEDYIKRVVGVEGDTVRIDHHGVAIRAAGDAAFHAVPRRRSAEPCITEAGENRVADCTVYDETLDGRTYRVQYEGVPGPSGLRPRVFQVPPGHLFVLGDNRSHSQDSTVWAKTGDVVDATLALTGDDLGPLAEDRVVRETDAERVSGDPTRDGVAYRHRARHPGRDVIAEVWQLPVAEDAGLGGGLWAFFVAEAEGRSGGRGEVMPVAIPGEGGAAAAEVVAFRTKQGFVGVGRRGEPGVVVRIECGFAACATSEAVAGLASRVLGRAKEKPSRKGGAPPLDDLVSREDDVTYEDLEERSDPTRFRRAVVTTADGAAVFRVTAAYASAWEADRLVDGALAELGGNRTSIARWDGLGAEAWLHEGPLRFTFVSRFDPLRFAVVATCERPWCRDVAEARGRFQRLQDEVPLVAGGWPGTPLVPTTMVPAGALRAEPRSPKPHGRRHRFDAFLDGPPRRVELLVELVSDDARAEASVGAEASAARGGAPAWARPAGAREVTLFDEATPGWAASEPSREVVAFASRDGRVRFHLACGRGLCPSGAEAEGLARRVADRVRRREDVIREGASYPSPFVPRGYVKGRAERVYLPTPRFWLPI